MNTVDEEQALLQRIAGLPREMQPRNDLWPGIAQRIDPASNSRPATRRFPAWPVAMAASVFAAFLVGMLLTRSWAPAAGDVVEVAGRDDAEPAVATLESASESEYVAAFREFLAIHPGPENVLAETWIGETQRVLHQTELELSSALRQSPNDPLLQKRMASLRAHQLDWLQQMAAAERNSRRIST